MPSAVWIGTLPRRTRLRHLVATLQRRAGPGRALATTLALASVAGACATSAPKPAGSPPTLGSVTRDEPGGDADDQHLAALERLLSIGWGWRSNNKELTLKVPLPDWENWRSVRYWGVPTFAGYRYGDAHHAVIAAWVRPVEEGRPDDPDGCLESFEAWSAPTAHAFNVELGSIEITRKPWRDGEVVIKSVDAEIRSLFSNKRYAAAYAAYVVWPGSCTILGIAVPLRDDADAARSVRDRYVREAFTRLEATPEAPPM